MMKKSFFLIALLLFGLLSACAKKPNIKYVWPPPPEEPKLEWMGSFYNEDSFPRSEAMQAFVKFVGEQQYYQMTSPFGIASDDAGRVYISDIHKHTVHVFDFNTKKVSALTLQAEFVTPAGLAVDAKGNVYVAEAAKGIVMVFTADGTPLFSFGQKEMTKPAYIAIDDETGRIYVSDGQAHFVGVFDMQGNFLFKIGEWGYGDGQFYAPQGLALSPGGRLYVADMLNARIQNFDLEGNFLASFGKRGDRVDQFENPKDVAFDSDGNLYVIDSRSSQLGVYTPSGKMLLSLGSNATTHALGLAVPKAIHIDNADRIYISEMTNKRFSIWQYYSDEYLKEHPYTDEDRQNLIRYREQITSENKR